MSSVRQPAVADMFYPADPQVLSREVQQFLDLAESRSTGAECPKAMIVPHAGYRYSGSTAGEGYALLKSHADTITRVVLLGPAHRVMVEGLALPEAEAFATPLGEVPIDEEAIRSLDGLSQVVVSGAAHKDEHSLEVQLPFLQLVLGSFKLVPLVVGRADSEQVAEVLNRLWGGPETLVVVSSDLSHYRSYDQARQTDEATVASILTGQPLENHEQACGALPINGLLLAAGNRGLKPRLVGFCNSGDTAGDRDQVVGYATITFTQPTAVATSSPQEPVGYTEEQGKLMISIARASIATALGRPATVDTSASWLRLPAAVFVTLTLNGQLRGCRGSVEPHRQLGADIVENARASAFADPRFKPVTLPELSQLKVEVSLLGPTEPMTFGSEDEALSQLRPEVDGVVLVYNQQRSLFLPQVWEKLRDPRQFMAQLKIKAGLSSGFWSDEVRLFRFSVQKWSEPEQPRPDSRVARLNIPKPNDRSFFTFSLM